MTRDERQEVCIDKWKAAKGRGIMLLATGFGKTRVALKISERLVKKKKDAKIIVAVPSDNLKTQWLKEIVKFGLHQNITVNTVHSFVGKEIECDLFIADEVHMFASEVFVTVFETIKSNLFLGLTGTLKRLDGRESLLLEYAPVVDEITLELAIQNKWVSDYVQYKLEIEVDLTLYEEYNRKFNHYFAYFAYNFDIAMACLSNYTVRAQYAGAMKVDPKEVMIKALGFSKAMRDRKNFIYNHVRKIELADKILASRIGRKAITFTKNVAHAKLISTGEVFHGGIKPASKKDKILADFNKSESGILNTCKAVDFGTDVEGVSLALMLSGDSASITKAQRMGRILRYSEGKVAEYWSFVIKGTAEEQWFKKANDGKKYTVVKENQLEALLRGDEDWQKEEVAPNQFLFVL